MMTADFLLTLTMPAVLTESAATTGGRRSLHHVPGGALLGLVAQRYDKAGSIAWEMFHSGAVRFSNAYPVLDGAPAVPAPLCWRTGKGDKAARDGVLIPEHIVPDGTEKVTGFVTRSQRLVTPKVARRARAAIDRHRGGQTRQGALFEDAALEAGQQFWFRVALDEAAWTSRALDLIRDVFAQPGLRVGGGRNSDYGGCAIAPFDPASAVDAVLEGNAADLHGGTRFQLYALSDLMLDDNGDSLTTELGLPGDWRIGERHVRRREVFAPFNRHRGTFSLDRAPLLRGSVFTLEGDTPLDGERIAARLAEGVGADREAGFGMVIANPWLLAEDKTAPAAAFGGGYALSGAPKAADAPQTDPVWQWAEARARRGEDAVALDRWLEAVLLRLEDAYRVAQREARITGQSLADIAPMASQWSDLREVAADTDLTALPGTLRTRGEGKGVATHKWRGGEGYAFAAILAEAFTVEALEAAQAPADRARREAFARRALGALAAAAPRRLFRDMDR